MKKDVVIIGGGAAGCRLAALLAEQFDILLIEEHENIGRPVQCAGLVSPRALDDLTRGSIICEIRDCVVHAPGGGRLELHASSPRGIVIDRAIYDHSLSSTAEDLGAVILTGVRATRVSLKKQYPTVTYRSNSGVEEVDASLVIGADGPKSITRRHVTDIGFGILYRGAQYTGELRDSDDSVEMWIGNDVTPGFFVWKVPAGDLYRIGLCTNSAETPTNLLDRFIRRHLPGFSPSDRQAGLIPIGPLGPLVSGRVALLGDAAGQTKPLTGGGIFMGKRASEILAESIRSEGAEQPALDAYERLYHDEFDTEISRAWLLRRVINGLSDRKLDRAAKILSDSAIIETMEISGDIDFPSALSSPVLRLAPRLVQFAPDLLRGLR